MSCDEIDWKKQNNSCRIMIFDWFYWVDNAVQDMHTQTGVRPVLESLIFSGRSQPYWQRYCSKQRDLASRSCFDFLMLLHMFQTSHREWQWPCYRQVPIEDQLQLFFQFQCTLGRLGELWGRCWEWRIRKWFGPWRVLAEESTSASYSKDWNFVVVLVLSSELYFEFLCASFWDVST